MIPTLKNRDSALWHQTVLSALKTGPSFVRESKQGFRIYRQRSAEAEQGVGHLLPNPDHAFQNATILKPGSKSHVGRVVIDGKPYVLKRYNQRTLGYRLCNALRRSRAMHSWLMAWHFLVRGLPVPEPLACLEEKRVFLLARSYVLMEDSSATQTLRFAWRSSDSIAKAQLLAFFANLFGRMHCSGILHGDLKWDNIMVDLKNIEDSARLVDIDGSKMLSHPSLGSAKKDIARFLKDLSKEDGVDERQSMFLKAWMSNWKPN
ncbi:MAG: lipopolysaccharide kinase InaA family protein [Desulfobacterales bacterium]